MRPSTRLVLLLMLYIPLVACRATPEEAPRRFPPISGHDTTRDIIIHEAGSLLPDGVASGPFIVRLDGKILHRGTVSRPHELHQVHVVKSLAPLPVTGDVTLTLEIAGRSFEATLPAVPDQYLLVIALGSPSTIAVDWTHDPRSE